MFVLKVSKEKQAYIVLFDTGEKVTVSEDLIVQFRLIKNKEISEKQFEELKIKAGYDRGLQKALNYISFQLRSELEVDRYLNEQEIQKNERKKIILQLKELGVLNDLFYAESFIRTQIALSDKGPKVFQQKLKEKGISEEYISQSLSIYSEELQLDSACQTILKLDKRIHNKSYRERIQKIRHGLIQKGHLSSIIDQAMNRVAISQNNEIEVSSIEKVGFLLLKKNKKLPFQKKKQKVKQALYVKGFDLDLIQEFIDRECIDETEEY